jgi:hypothetical protein
LWKSGNRFSNGKCGCEIDLKRQCERRRRLKTTKFSANLRLARRGEIHTPSLKLKGVSPYPMRAL